MTVQPFAVKELEDERSILIDREGEPQRVELLMRPSTTSPTRIKAVLGVKIPLVEVLDEGEELPEDFDPDQTFGLVPMPFATTQIGLPGCVTEFRLEMN